MASVKMGVRDKERLGDDFKRLLGRCYGITKMPIPTSELPAMFNRVAPPSLVAAYNTAKGMGYDCNDWFTTKAWFNVELRPGYFLSVSLGSDAGYARNKDYLNHEFIKLPQHMYDLSIAYCCNQTNYLTVAGLRLMCGDRYNEFEEWMLNYVKLVIECTKAWETASKIIDMTGTAGQLKRMVPEMIQYLPVSKRRELEDQKRSSSLPYEWAAYDRVSVRDMLTTMAKCYLMPEQEYKRMIDHAPACTVGIGAG